MNMPRLKKIIRLVLIIRVAYCLGCLGYEKATTQYPAYRVATNDAQERLVCEPLRPSAAVIAGERVRVWRITSMLLLKAYHHASWVHRSNMAVFYVGDCPTGWQSPYGHSARYD